VRRALTIALAVALLAPLGCGPGRRQVQTMNAMKQLCNLRIEAITTRSPIPSLEEAGKSLGIDVTLIEATQDWANPKAPYGAIVLQERIPVGGSRIVASADGRVVQAQHHKLF